MLVAQAVKAAEHFLGTAFGEDVIASIVNSLEREKEHVILIGMPSCGKTTVGRLLSKMTGRPLIDLDSELVARCGCDIPTYFREHGEAAFRDLEAEVLKECLYGTTGAVISTGGGAPLRPENRAVMHATGRVYWIDRCPTLLTPTSDRPTAASREALEARYRERYDVYRMASDVRVDGDTAAQAVADYILKEHTV